MTDIEQRLENSDINEISEKLGVGIPTIKDIAKELAKPGRDPRDENYDEYDESYDDHEDYEADE